jgi:hypothetical protein
MATPPPPPPGDSPGPAPPPPPPSRSFLPGIGLTLLLHLLLIPLGVVAGILFCALAPLAGSSGLDLGSCILIVGGALVLLIGASQLVYMLPAIFIARRRGRYDLVQGLVIGAAVTFLLNAGCWGFVTFGSRFG